MKKYNFLPLLATLFVCIFAIPAHAGTYSGGDGSEGNPYEIDNTGDLIELSNNSDDWGDYFIQTSDISFDEDESNVDWNGDGSAGPAKGFSPIGGWFTGSYNGQNHTITNLFINSGGDSYIGLFGRPREATIKNLILENVDISGDSNTGGLMGLAYNTDVDNCSVYGSVSGTENVGGLIGGNSSNSSLTGSHNDADVSSTAKNTGGLVGNVDDNLTITDCYNSGDVSGGNDNIGGLVGFKGESSTLTITDSYNEGTIAGNGDYIGGLIGCGENWPDQGPTHVDNCYNTGNIGDSNAGSYVGGLIGANGKYSSNTQPIENSYSTGNVTGANDVGGLIGRNDSDGPEGIISKCYATGDVTASENRAGGLISTLYRGEVKDSYYKKGTVTGIENIGGLIGTVGSYVGSASGYNRDISSSFSTGNVIGENNAGGFAGFVYGDNIQISNCYSRGDVTRASGASASDFGGFCGHNLGSTIEYCYSTGDVIYDGANDPTDKGFVGSEDGTTTYINNFFDSDESNQSSATGATAKTTAEMKLIDTYTDTQTEGLTSAWDFTGDPYDDTANEDYWGINSEVNNGYPFLMWQGYTAHYPPKASTAEVASVTEATATVSGSITDLGVPNPTTHGVCWSTSENPTTDDTCNDQGAAEETGEFTASITGLSSDTEYHVRAFATNDAGTAYGDNVSFTTKLSVTLEAGPNDGGTTSPSSGAQAFSADSPVDITATPNGGYEFSNWSADPDANADFDDASSASTKVTLSGQATVTANFVPSMAGDGSEGTPYQIQTWYDLNVVRNYLDKHFELQNDLDTNTDGYAELVSPDAVTQATQFLGSSSGVAAGTELELQTAPVDEILSVIDTLGNSELSYSRDLENGTITLDEASGGQVQVTYTAKGMGWNPIGPSLANIPRSDDSFRGSFHGGNNKIQGLYSNRPYEMGVGLFSATADSVVVQKLRIENADITGFGFVGSLVGYAIKDSHIEDIMVSGTVSGIKDVGGILGTLKESFGTIDNCTSDVHVSGTSNVGGLVGTLSNSILQNSSAHGDVVGVVPEGGEHQNFGGLVGQAMGGLSDPAEIINSYATGAVHAPDADNVGGLVGWFVDTNNDTSTITNSYASGTVQGSATATGGLVGFMATPSGATQENKASIKNSFWDTETSGMSAGVGDGDNSGVTGKNTADMTDKSAFTDAGWQFGNDNEWSISDGHSRPYLSWQDVAVDNGYPENRTATSAEFPAGNIRNYSGESLDLTYGYMYRQDEPPTWDNCTKTEPESSPEVSSGSNQEISAETIASLDPSTTYYARAYATDGTTTWYGDTVRFETPEVPSDPTVLLKTPRSNLSTTSTNPEFSWSGGSTGTASYKLYVSTTPDVFATGTSYDVGDAQSFSLQDSLTPGASYYWGIELTDDVGTVRSIVQPLTVLNQDQGGDIVSGIDNANVVSDSIGGPVDIRLADLDGDGDLDLVAASRPDNAVFWYENTDGAGTFGPAQTITTNAVLITRIQVGDLDGDGDLDVMSASAGDDKIAWYSNDGSGNFGAQQVITTNAAGARDLVLFDQDGDGALDVAVASFYDNTIAWYKNDGAGNFGPRQIISQGSLSGPVAVNTADLNGDGAPDIIAFSKMDGRLVWYANSGAGGFDAEQEQEVDATGFDQTPDNIDAADLDGDGDLDLLLSSKSRVDWYENTDGAGSFSAAREIYYTTSSYH